MRIALAAGQVQRLTTTTSLNRLYNLDMLCAKFAQQPMANLVLQDIWFSSVAQYMVQVRGSEAFIMIEPTLSHEQAIRMVKGIREDLDNLRVIYKERGVRKVAYLDMAGDDDNVARFWRLIGVTSANRVWLGMEEL